MPHIVFAGQRVALTESQVVEVKDKLAEAAAAARPLELTLVGADGHAVWLFWTPGAPIVIDDGEIPAMQEFPMPDFSSLGLPGLTPPPPTRRAGF